MRGLGSTLTLVLVAGGCTEATLAGGRASDRPYPVSAPSPAQMEASADRHPPCAVAAPGSGDGTITRLRDDPAVTLRLPAGFVPANWEGATSFQTWMTADTTVLMVAVSPGGSFDFAIDGVAVVEGACSRRIAGRLSSVTRSHVLLANQRDTAYLADVNVPHQADRSIGAGVFSRTAAGRERALSALTTLRVDEH